VPFYSINALFPIKRGIFQGTIQISCEPVRNVSENIYFIVTGELYEEEDMPE